MINHSMHAASALHAKLGAETPGVSTVHWVQYPELALTKQHA